MANKETRIFTTNTLEELRQKTNEVSLHLGDNELFDVSLTDKVFNYNTVGAGDILFSGNDDNSKTQKFNIKTEETLDNTAGYIILTGSPTITGFVADAIVTQTGGYSATIVSASTDRILVKNASGTFSSSSNLSVGVNTILAANVARIVAEAFNIGVVRVYVNGTEISQNLLAGGFHVPNYAAEIPLLNSPTVAAFTEGSTVYQGTNLASATFSGTVLSVSATELKLKNYTGTFSGSVAIKIDGSASTITGVNHSDITVVDTTIGNAIRLNTPAVGGDNIKVYSPSVVDAVNELQDDVGVTENLTTQAVNLVGAVNEIEAVFDASTHEISAGTTAFTVNSGIFTVDSSGDIILDADDADVVLKDNGVQYGTLTNTSGNLIVKSGTTTMLTGAAANATFAQDVTVTRDVDIDRNLNVDGTTELNSNLGVDGNFRVGSSNTSKFDVAADTGNTQIDGTLEVDGAAGIDGDLRVGVNKFNVTASTGNTQIDGTLEVDGTAGVDGNFRVGSSGEDKFNVTAASGNTQIDGTLNVDSTTTLNGTTIDGNLDLNGSVDVSTNATIHGVLDVDGVSNLDDVDIDGDVDIALTLQVDGNTTIGGILDVGTLSANFNLANRNDVKLALNEAAFEIGAVTWAGTDTTLSTLNPNNLTTAINALDLEIGDTDSYNDGIYGAATISGTLDLLQAGMINNDTDITNLFADVGTLVLVDNLPADYTYTITDLTTATNTMSGFIGNLSIADIGSTDTVTGALQKLHAEIGDSVLTVFSAPNRNISGALRELEAEKVYLTSSSQQEISSKLGLTGNVTFKNGGTNNDTMTFNSGTTLDLSNASLLLPGNASNVAIFSTSFLEVDGNVQIQGFSVDRQHVATIVDKADVRLQWNENYADGTTATRPARSWQIQGLNDSSASHTTDIVTFYNAKELISNNTESGINVTWDATNENFDFNVNDPFISFTGDVTGSGTLTNLGDLSIGLTIQPNSVALTTDTTGDYIRTLTGTTNQITVSGAGTEGRAATLSIPTDFRAPGTVKILGTTASSSSTTGALTVAGGVGIGEDLYVAGDLYVEGSRVELNTTTLTVEDTLVLAGNNLSSEPATGGFGLEVGPITSPTGLADGVTGAHSIVYNYANSRWEADGSLILSTATNNPPLIEGLGFAAGDNLVFSASTGLSEAVTVSGTTTTVTYTNTDRGSSQAIFKNITASAGGTATANINNDTLSLLGGSQINTTRLNDTITFDHADTSTLNGTYGQAGAEDGTYIKSVTVDSNGHLTGVTSDDFDDRYDNYGSWQMFLNGTSTDSITSGERFGFDAGAAITLSYDNDDLTISHADTSSVGNLSENHSGNTFIQDLALTFDTFGHVTGATATEATVSIGDGTTTAQVPATATTTAHASGIVLTGDTNWSANQTGASSFQIAHANTSSVVDHSNDNSGNTVIQDLSVTFDTFGHVTGISTTDATINTVTNSSLVDVDQANDNTNYQVGFFPTDSSGYSKPYIDTDNSHFVYNPSTTLLSGVNLDWSNVTNKPSVDNYANWKLYVNSSLAKTVTSTGIVGFNPANAGISLAFVSGQNVQITNTMYANNTGIKDDSRNTLGVTRLYRNDDNSNFSVQNHYDGSRWFLRGYNGDSFHAECRVGYADSAGTVPAAVIDARIGNGQIDGRTAGLGLSGDMDATANQGGNTTFTVTSNAVTTATANTLAYRDSAADITARLFRSEYATTNGSIGYIMTQVNTGADNYIRPSTATQIRTFLNVADGAAAYQTSVSGSSGSCTGNAATATDIRVVERTTENVNYHILAVAPTIGGTSKTVNGHASFYWNGNAARLVAPNITANISACTNYAYGNLTGTPTIPTHTSHLTHNSGWFVNGGALSATTGTFSGNVTSTGDIIAAYTSDERLKDNIEVIPDALNKISKLRGVSFDWNDKQDVYEGHDIGVIAQDVQAVLPELVQERDNGYLAVKYEKMVALLIEGIKELTEENKLIRSELQLLKSINR